MYSSSSYFHDGCTSDYLSSFQTDFLTSNLNFLDASVSLYEGSEKQKCLPERDYCSPTDAISSSVCSSRPEFCPSRDAGPLLTIPDPSSGCGSSVGDWFLNRRLEAKRARVENIIKGMSSTTDLSESMLGNKEVQALAEGCRSDHDSSVTSQTDACTDLHGEFDHSACVTHDGWKRLLSATRTKSDRIELMTDVLKCELSRAIGRSIDSIFKTAPLLQTSPPDQGSLQAPACSRGRQPRQAEDVQTEALSLVVPKAAQETTSALSLQCGTRDASPPLSESSLKKKAHQNAQGRPKVSSRSLRSLLVDPPPRPLHRIKIESDATANNYLYMLNVSLQERNRSYSSKKSGPPVLSLTLPLGGPDRQPSEESKADVLLHSLPELTGAESLLSRRAGEC